MTPNGSHKGGEMSLPSAHVLTKTTTRARVHLQEPLSILSCEHLQLQASNVSHSLPPSHL